MRWGGAMIDRTIFAQNLSQLIAGVRGVSRFCENIGISRSQLNRYLDGSSSPNIVVLSKLCAYFDVDARILLEPLDQIRKPQFISRFDFINDRLSAIAYDLDETYLPCGIYRLWRYAFSQPGKIYCALARVFEHGEQKVWRSLQPNSVLANDEACNLRNRETKGIIFKQDRGFSVFMVEVRCFVLGMYYFEKADYVHSPVFHGVGMNSLPSSRQSLRVYPQMLEKIGSQRGCIMRAARKTGFHHPSAVSQHILDVLNANASAPLAASI